MSKVLLIGWDAADWKVINPLLDSGLMPSLQSLIDGGVKGKIATLDPPLSPTLWTSIATGKRPYKHGIHGFTEPTEDGKAIRPIYSTNRTCKAIWNILNQQELKSNVVGWWPSHPAEPINGTMISNLYQKAEMDETKPWKLLNGCVHPSDKSDFYSKLRVHPYEITANHILPFVPDLAKIDQSTDRNIQTISKILADASSVHCAATYIMENEKWDFMAVYYDAIDHFCHAFMRYHPPRRDHVSMKNFELYKDVVKSAYLLHDMMLARLLELTDENTTVILISDHGFHPNHNRPKYIPSEPTGPAIEHSPFGIFVMKGPDIKKDELIFGASLLDVTPTILNIFDLPVGTDMDGKVLINAFEIEKNVKFIDSWENKSGNDGRHTKDAVISEEDMSSELQQLIDLGYIEDPGKDIEIAIRNTLNENNYNLARAYFNGNLWGEGIEILEKLHFENPEVLRFSTFLIHGFMMTGQYKKARKLVDHIHKTEERESPQLEMLEATLLLAEERPLKAIKLLKKVEEEAGYQPQLNLKIANAYIQLKNYDEAERILKLTLKEDSEEFGSWYALGICHFEKLEYENALDAFLSGTALMYYHPQSHFYVAECLFNLGLYENATEALKVCLTIAPHMNVARTKLIYIYEHCLNQPDKVIELQNEFQVKLKGEITIVSGLPRSGTSMMMQILEAGGAEIFTDNIRTADENNKKGYYEHEAVKNSKKNNSWVKEANGKAVKVIAHLLPYLPQNYKYKIIFMERDINAIISSQNKMLERDGKTKALNTYPLQLVQAFETTVKMIKNWADKSNHVEIIYVDYDQVIEHNEQEIYRINTFLDNRLNHDQMSKVASPQMRREFKIQMVKSE